MGARVVVGMGEVVFEVRGGSWRGRNCARAVGSGKGFGTVCVLVCGVDWVEEGALLAAAVCSSTHAIEA